MPPAKRVRPRRTRAKKKPPQVADCAPEPAPLEPSGTKVAEGPDNLLRRAEWFKRRSGLG